MTANRKADYDTEYRYMHRLKVPPFRCSQGAHGTRQIPKEFQFIMRFSSYFSAINLASWFLLFDFDENKDPALVFIVMSSPPSVSIGSKPWIWSVKKWKASVPSQFSSKDSSDQMSLIPVCGRVFSGNIISYWTPEYTSPTAISIRRLVNRSTKSDKISEYLLDILEANLEMHYTARIRTTGE